MKHKIGLSLLVLFSALVVFPKFASADSKSDYEYQLSQYRKNFSEFSVLKRDFLSNPTLDNEQKSMILAKQTLLARDLAKASYASYLIDLIQKQNTQYPGLAPIIQRLSDARDFFKQKSSDSQKIVTPTELKDFTANYIKEVTIQDEAFLFGQVAYKLSQLIRFQIDTDTTFQSMLPKLPDPQPAPLKARIDYLPTQAKEINDNIDQLSSAIVSDEILRYPQEPNGYFRPMQIKIDSIKDLQKTVIDELIDIDTTYAQSKI